MRLGRARGAEGNGPWRRLFRLNLRGLILWLTVVGILIALGASFYASYLVQRDVLIANTLESNRAYAIKTAEVADLLIDNASRQLLYGARALGVSLQPPSALQGELDRLLLQSSAFNSIGFVTPDAVLRGVAPAPLQSLIGRQSVVPEIHDALAKRQAIVSEPFLALSGRWIIALTQPVSDAGGNFLGALIGTIYLHEENLLHTLLANQPYRNGSYLFVVDRAGRLIYHPQRERIGEVVMANAAVQSVVMRRQSGDMRLKNTLGVPMLAGYAPMTSTGWGVIAQRPVAITLTRQTQLLWDTVRNTLPLLVVLFIAIWWLSRLISRPLSQMAQAAERMDNQAAGDRIARVRAWYLEADQLKRALLAGLASVNALIRNLRTESTTDPLTGLLNRRGIAAVREQLGAAGTPFGVVTLDIDHFKQVNDVYGHDAGDVVLQQLAMLMRENARVGDVLGRLGGEEFVMLLPEISLAQSEKIAERLRVTVEKSVTRVRGGVTVSLGVAHCPTHTGDPQVALQLADKALYDAKRAGRNRVCVAPAA